MLRMSSSTSPSSISIVGSVYSVESWVRLRSISVVAMTYPPLLNLSAAPRDTLRADRVRSSRLSRSSLTLATLDDLFAKAEQPFDERLRPRRAARDIHVDGYDGVDALERGVAVPKLAARGRAVPHSDDPLRLGHLLVEPAQ